MAGFEMKNMTGMMFPVQDRKTDKYPLFSGTMSINGETYEVAEWERKGKTSGKPYRFLSIKFKNKDNNRPQVNNQQQSQTNAEDDLPF